MRRNRHAKIVATVGPASASPEMLKALFLAGVDVFRLNFSHGTQDDHAAVHGSIRRLEREMGRPIGILQDLQGPKIRIGDGRVRLSVAGCGKDDFEARVTVGGMISNRKGVNLPKTVLNLSPLTEKDRADLAFGLELGVEWVALSFVQKPSDLIEARGIIGEHAGLMS